MTAAAPFYSRRCSTCELNWPLAGDYRRCPNCQMSTWLSPSPKHESMGESEGRSLKNHLEFERFYRQRVEAQGLAEISLLLAGVA